MSGDSEERIAVDCKGCHDVASLEEIGMAKKLK
jgi:hypothetical protein